MKGHKIERREWGFVSLLRSKDRDRSFQGQRFLGGFNPQNSNSFDAENWFLSHPVQLESFGNMRLAPVWATGKEDENWVNETPENKPHWRKEGEMEKKWSHKSRNLFRRGLAGTETGLRVTESFNNSRINGLNKNIFIIIPPREQPDLSQPADDAINLTGI